MRRMNARFGMILFCIGLTVLVYASMNPLAETGRRQDYEQEQVDTQPQISFISARHDISVSLPLASNLYDMSAGLEQEQIITYRERQRLFCLQMRNSSLVFRINSQQLPQHMHYGGRVACNDDVLDYLQQDQQATSFDAGDKNSHAYEYSDYGTGDYRVPSFRVQYSDGSSLSPLTYQSFKIAEGIAQDIPVSVPHFRFNGQRASTLTVTLLDELKLLQVQLVYTVFADHNVVVRHVNFENHGNATVVLQEANSLSLDMPPTAYDRPYYMTQLSGSWSRERQVVSRQMESGITGFDSRRGASSAQQNPFMVISRGPLNEFHGEHLAFGLVYASSHHFKAQLTQTYTMRVIAGLHPDTFEWHLEPQKTFQTPQAFLSYSSTGMGELSRNLHRLIRVSILPGAQQTQWTPKVPRPVLVNSWEAMYFKCTEDKIMKMLVEPAKRLGLDLVVLDDGWFVNRMDDHRALGDWEVDRKKFPNGLSGLSAKIHERGLKFGIWMEPEMISRDSRLYEQHPDWCLHVPGRARTESRNQLVLDLSRQNVQDFIVTSVTRVLTESNADYMKWDFNRHLTEIGNEVLDGEHQGELLHRWTLGLYSVLHRITSKFPQVLFEQCAGGGSRYDLAMMFYSSQIWTSDNTDAIARAQIQWGTSMAYPANGMAAHVSTVPNHQLKRTTSFFTRHVMAMSGVMGYELDLLSLSDDEQQAVVAFTIFYKQYIAHVVMQGDLYRLHSPFPQARLTQTSQTSSWMFVMPDQSEAVVYVNLSSYRENVVRTHHLKLQGLCAECKYQTTRYAESPFGMYMKEQQVATLHGTTLMSAGVVTPLEHDADSLLFILKRVS